MHPIKFLKPEIAEIIEEITSRFSDMNPIDKLIHLKKFIMNNYFFTLQHIIQQTHHTLNL